MKSGEPAGSVDVLRHEVARLAGLEQRLRTENDELMEARRDWEESVHGHAELFDVSPLPSLVIDKAGFVRKANAAAVKLLGNGVCGSALRSQVVLPDRRRFLDLMTTAARSPDAEITGELSLCRHSGKPVHVRLTARRLRSQSAAIVTVTDLSEHDQTVERYRELEESVDSAKAATEARDKFIAMLSHELRTPLTPVLAAVSAALSRDDAPAPIKKTFAMIARNVEAERRLIDDLLDTSRIVHGKLSLDRLPIDVHRVAREALAAVMPELTRKGLQVSIELQAERSWVSADAGRVRQVFWNLLQNAVKFSPEGGTVSLHSWNRDGVLAIEVRDIGTGIAPQMLPRLFAPFQQGEPNAATVPSRAGLGLGLAICRGIVDLHGGQIHATSPGLGRGARFVVDLPCIDAPPRQAVEPRQAVPERATTRPRILLVEDDEDTAETLAELLRLEGFHISVANSIASALKRDVGEVDFVLSDIGLGDGTGLELMRRLRTKKDVPGIVLSGYGTEADILASQAAGFSAHLVKPVSIDKLVAAIYRTASGPAGSA